MPFHDPRIAKALEIFASRNVHVQRELQHAARMVDGTELEARRTEIIQAAFMRAVEDNATNAHDFALRYLARTPQELEAMREERRLELARTSPVVHLDRTGS